MGLLGLAVGSFNNVVIARVPAGESVATPASRCSVCGHPIRHRHNIPVLSWLVLRGRCADCRSAISARYPFVELGTAALFAALTVRLGHAGLPALPAYLYFAAAGVALALIDINCHRLPDVIVLPAYPIILTLLGVAALIQRDGAAMERAVISAAGLFGGYFLLAFAYPAGMGFGDVKLAGVIGAVLGYLSWGTLAVGAFAGFALGSIFAVALMATRRVTRKSAVAFGPFMIAGALLAVFSGDGIAHAYVHLMVGG